MGGNCAKCGTASKRVAAKGDLCLACAMGWPRGEEPKEREKGLRALLECHPPDGAGACGKCLSCEQAKNGKLLEALSFYADKKTYRTQSGIGYTSPAPVLADAGKGARIALGVPR